MKALKIVGSILLVLVLVAGTYVGVITKGFRKWKNLKTEKQNVTNFINYGKNGIPSEDYKALANENEQLTKTVDDLTEDNSKLLSEKTTLTNQVDNLTEDNSRLLSEKTTLTNQVDNLTDEKNTLSEKNSELQEKLDAQSKFKIENRRFGYEVFLYSQGSMFYNYGSWNFEQNRVLSLANLYSEFFNNFSQTDSMGLIHITKYDLTVFNETENRYEVICNFNNAFESEDISPDDVDFSFVTNYSDNITEERKNMIENNIDDGASIEFLPTLDVSINEDGRYTAIFSLNILSVWV